MKRRILIAENDAEKALALCNALGRMGYEVDLFSDGARVLERAAYQNYWGVILSLHMPGLNGIDAARALRGHRPALRIALVSDAITDGIRRQVAEIPGAHLLDRAVNEYELREVLEQAPARAPRWDVLLIEDFEPVRTLVRSTFERVGCNVHAVADGGSAIWAAAQGRAEVAIVDMAVPGPQGAELVRKLHEANPKMYVVVITGGATDEELDGAREAGARWTMRKPFRPDALVAALRERQTEIEDYRGRN